MEASLVVWFSATRFVAWLRFLQEFANSVARKVSAGGDAGLGVGSDFTKQVKDMGIAEALSTPRSPWQRAYIERLIGTIRRECVDHMIVFNESSLYRRIQSFLLYYQLPTRAASWPFRKSAVFTIDTNAELPDLRTKVEALDRRRFQAAYTACENCSAFSGAPHAAFARAKARAQARNYNHRTSNEVYDMATPV
jgi:transposase InsO family protein